MPPSKPEPEVAAVQRVFEALKPLDQDGQQRVLSAALALLGLSFTGMPSGSASVASQPVRAGESSSPHLRAKGLTEFLNEKTPGTSSQRIVLFAFYRERHEAIATFSRVDLRPYFAKAKLTPPSNYDRDFSTAVERGWIHEDGSNSYITQKGVDLVESGFEGERTYAERAAGATGHRKSKKASKKSNSKKTGKKK